MVKAIPVAETSALTFAQKKPTLTPVSMELRGVRVHNLKDLDLDIPLHQLIAVSGVSGSGKSSLAFDTLFAEGQRRYIESFSTSSRSLLEQVERPDADRIAHVPVAIAIRSDHQGSQRSDGRSIVATVGELLDGLRQLFARTGRIVCPSCDRDIRASTASDVSEAISRLPPGTRCQLLFGVTEFRESGSPKTWLARGFSRGVWDGATHDLGSMSEWPTTGAFWLVSDRFVAGKTTPDRVRESAEAAFREGKGRCLLLMDDEDQTIESKHASLDQIVAKGSVLKCEIEVSATAEWTTASVEGSTSVPKPLTTQMELDGKRWRIFRYSRRLECNSCRREFLPVEPRLFSHLSSGACLSCRGTGKGEGDADCLTCSGTRYRAEAISVKVGNRSIVDLGRLNPSAVKGFLRELKDTFTADQWQQTDLIRADIERRLDAVCDLGLDYLTLDRAAETLSGGEFRRLRLAAVIGSGITGTLVVVDEPSSGLTMAEVPRVVAALRRLLTLRNSVVVVDHSPPVISAADYVIELGPAAGPLGGSIVFQGPVALRTDATEGTIPSSGSRASGIRNTSRGCVIVKGSSCVKKGAETLRMTNVRHRNLFDLQIAFPLGKLCVVSGASGSGKTSLVTQVLYPAICRRLELPRPMGFAGTCELSGGGSLVDVVLIDQSALTKSARSNPATWLEVFDEIRQTFAATADAKQRGFTSRQFSFNSSSGGRCRSCLGTGQLKHDMQFLPDVTFACPECQGTRYRPEVLSVKYRGRSIADVLAMSVSEAASFFRSQPRIQKRFQMLNQIGLDYLVLGQPSETLSGGEAQRLKLAARLAMPSNGGCLIVCDEPTSGLHPIDVRCLVTCFRELIANGNSLVLADNSPELLNAADYVVELG